jgi:hypothetical protein
MRASPTTETTARTICRRIRAKREVFLSGCIDGREALDIQSGLSLAIERGWLARRSGGYVLTREGQEVAHRSGSKAVNVNSIGFGLR